MANTLAYYGTELFTTVNVYFCNNYYSKEYRHLYLILFTRHFDITCNDITYNDFTFNDFIYNDITYNTSYG